jgi:hypothetical protein
VLPYNCTQLASIGGTEGALADVGPAPLRSSKVPGVRDLFLIRAQRPHIRLYARFGTWPRDFRILVRKKLPALTWQEISSMPPSEANGTRKTIRGCFALYLTAQA